MTDTRTRVHVPALLTELNLEEKAAGSAKEAEGDGHVGLGVSVLATCFPTASGLASSWDPALARRVGKALGDECRAADVAVLLGPGVNMKRSPLCGRNFEYFSEDPLLAGELGAALVEGHPEPERRRLRQALRRE